MDNLGAYQTRTFASSLHRDRTDFARTASVCVRADGVQISITHTLTVSTYRRDVHE